MDIAGELQRFFAYLHFKSIVSISSFIFHVRYEVYRVLSPGPPFAIHVFLAYSVMFVGRIRCGDIIYSCAIAMSDR